MQIYLSRSSPALAILLLASSALAAPAPLVLHNAVVHTADEARPRAEAVVAVDGRITFVGSSADALRRAPANAERIDLEGQAVFPGFTDAHAHLDGIGFRELEFNLQDVGSLKELQQRLRERATQTKPGDWLAGRGWIESRWTPAVFPTRQDLDAVVADRAVVLRRADGHALIANSLALRRAGIDRDTPAPPGGEIPKDASGEPTGMLIDEAMALVNRLVPSPTDAEISKALEVGAARSTKLGWTQIQNPGTSWKQVDLLCQLYAQGKVKLRVYTAIDGPSADAQRLLKEGRSVDRCGAQNLRSIKLYVDGALGSRGAALLEPYADAPQSTGLIVNEPETLFPILTQALKQGIQIETHAIGDRGNRIMLDLYERAFAEVPVKERAVAEPRWRIEHAQVINPADIPRFAKLGVIASMQPSHAIGDLFFAPQRLGPKRLTGAYAWKSLLDAGAIVVAGSDAPVEQGDPRIEFYAAVERKSVDGISNADWHREERVSRAQALKMLTLAPAFAAFQERERGSIEVGKQADFTVFAADLMSIPEPQILKTPVALTVIGGEIVYRASEHHVDRGNGDDGSARIVSRSREDGAHDHAHPRAPVEFDGGREL
jgi:predicted amidohydrolase YtcJ